MARAVSFQGQPKGDQNEHQEDGKDDEDKVDLPPMGMTEISESFQNSRNGVHPLLLIGSSLLIATY